MVTAMPAAQRRRPSISLPNSESTSSTSASSANALLPKLASAHTACFGATMSFSATVPDIYTGICVTGRPMSCIVLASNSLRSYSTASVGQSLDQCARTHFHARNHSRPFPTNHRRLVTGLSLGPLPRDVTPAMIDWLFNCWIWTVRRLAALHRLAYCARISFSYFHRHRHTLGT